jgi:hypothetical protein
MKDGTERALPPAVWRQFVLHRDVKRKMGSEAKLRGVTETALLHETLCKAFGLDPTALKCPKTTRPKIQPW